MKGRCRVGVQQLEEAWALRTGAREAQLLAAPHVPAGLSLLGIVRPGDRLVSFADDFADAFERGFDALPGEFRTSPAGGATTRLSAPRGKQGSTVRLFAGTDDPLIVAATLDNALRN